MINHISTKQKRLLEDLFGSESEDDEDDEEEGFFSLEELTDDEQDQATRRQRLPNKERSHVEGHQKLMQDYFNEGSTYNNCDFERRFRLRKELFLKIAAAVVDASPYFVQKADCTGKIGLSSFQKITSALRQLAYGCAMDATDEYCRTSESTARQTLRIFCNTINNLYANEYLRTPTANDLIRMLDVNNTRGFPGCIGSLDCMHWAWKNCPSALAGQYKGKEKRPTVVLEAVADQRLWIWHTFFGTAGALNDINILDRSPLFEDQLAGTAWDVEFKVCGRHYKHAYYLVDGIYPSWSTLIKAKGVSQDEQSQHFQKLQEAFRKDIERAFGVLQARWAIITIPARFWDPNDMVSIMRTCFILEANLTRFKSGQSEELSLNQQYNTEGS
ncbi:hypothetical protein MJO28_006165 [Puccinia striiformis f. sp. tritici]|uniref:Uncharacterized protein n=1 Tax=Puccinia striiformis f. sp. tritici TaxID=168172 RepID=A0ACC0EGN8_9BASI|nr:hypothetical protein MJO28_006165 [Puccinia striiformis f. sp. tritici]